MLSQVDDLEVICIYILLSWIVYGIICMIDETKKTELRNNQLIIKFAKLFADSK